MAQYRMTVDEAIREGLFRGRRCGLKVVPYERSQAWNRRSFTSTQNPMVCEIFLPKKAIYTSFWSCFFPERSRWYALNTHGTKTL